LKAEQNTTNPSAESVTLTPEERIRALEERLRRMRRRHSEEFEEVRAEIKRLKNLAASQT
jgi:protein-arginine kinase activator protein McsA